MILQGEQVPNFRGGRQFKVQTLLFVNLYDIVHIPRLGVGVAFSRAIVQ